MATIVELEAHVESRITELRRIVTEECELSLTFKDAEALSSSLLSFISALCEDGDGPGTSS
jgi:hypothetical protein